MSRAIEVPATVRCPSHRRLWLLLAGVLVGGSLTACSIGLVAVAAAALGGGGGGGHDASPVTFVTTDTIGLQSVPGTPAQPFSVRALDYDGDGILDLVVTLQQELKVAILRGLPQGGFGPKFTKPCGAGTPVEIAFGDFSSDGKPDLALPLQNKTFSILLNNGTGSFNGNLDLPLGEVSLPAVAGDFNRDGFLDVALGDVDQTKVNTSISILIGNGAGGFTESVTPAIAGRVFGLALADFDRDGSLDLAATAKLGLAGADTVSILLGAGDGSFGAPTVFNVGTGPEGVAVGDFNGDGRADLAVANIGDSTKDILGTISILVRNDNPGLHFDSHDVSSGAPCCNHVEIGDLNGDGKPDLAVTNVDFINAAHPVVPGSVSILLGDGQGGFGGPTNSVVGKIPRSVTIGDFDRDGRPDLAVANLSDDTLSILTNKTTFAAAGTFVAATAASSLQVPDAVATGDFDRDGKLDLAVVNAGNGIANGTVTIFLRDAGVPEGFSPGAVVTVEKSPQAIAVGDFNRDGRLDLAVANGDSGTVSIVLADLNVPGAFTAPVGKVVGSVPQSVVTADFDRDGDLDLVVAAAADGTVRVFRGDGLGDFSNFPPTNVGNTPFALASADFDDDGLPDLAVANAGDGNVSILLAKGDGTFTEATNSPFDAGTQPCSLAAGDFNGDGRPDLAVGNAGDATVSILLGVAGSVGDFVPANPATIGVGTQPRSVVVGDFDRDGRPDLAVANATSDTISILFGKGAGNFAVSGTVGVEAAPVSLAVGDFNADGKPDLASSNQVGTSVSILTNR